MPSIRQRLAVLALSAGLSVAVGNPAKPRACAPAPAAARGPATTPVRPFVERLERLAWPMRFEPNEGQFGAGVRYVARAGATTLFLTDAGATLSLGALHVAMTLSVVGARAVAPRASEPLASYSNDFRGSDPSRWRTHVPNFGRVTYPSALDGVDLVYHGHAGALEYDFVIAPGADPGAAVVEVAETSGLSLTADGDLSIHTARGEILQHRPRMYQIAGGAEREVPGTYRLVGPTRVAFAVSSYDRALPLVIDPVLSYSTFLGGANATFGPETSGTAVAVDPSGNVYVTGSTNTSDFPTKDALFGSLTLSTSGGGITPTFDAFVTKFSPSGSSLVYSTYLGGSLGDVGNAIAVDARGNAYVVGSTSSKNFPTKNALFAPPMRSTGFVARLDSTGAALVYSTFLGGSQDSSTHPSAVAVDASGNAYIAGQTAEPDFPTTNALLGSIADSATSPGPGGDAFVTELDATGSRLVYSTFLGGSFRDGATGIAVDASGSAYVTGATSSPDFPTRSALFATLDTPADGGPRSGTAAFVTRLAPSGAALIYSTFLGGEGGAGANAIALDAAGNAYVTGNAGAGFPTKNALFPSIPAFEPIGITPLSAFVAKISPAGSTLLYSTYLGADASHSSFGNGIAVDESGNAYVAGTVESPDLPVRGATCSSVAGQDSAFVAALSSAGSALLYSMYLGGDTTDTEAAAIAVDPSGRAYVTGFTDAADFPVSRAVYPTFQGTPGPNADPFSTDAFLAEIDRTPGMSEAVCPSPEDASGPGLDGGTRPASRVGGGCSCNATPSHGGWPWGVVVASFVLRSARRRLRPRTRLRPAR